MSGNNQGTWDPWTPYGCLYFYLGQDGPSTLGIPLFAAVAEVWIGDIWLLPSTRSERQLQLLAYVTTLSSSVCSDVPIWSVSGILQKTFVSKAVWNEIRPSKPYVTWASLVWHKATIPRYATTAWLFLLNLNPTLGCIHNCDVVSLTTCLLCGMANESRDHLFFECHFSLELWQKITNRLQISPSPSSWSATILWLPIAHGDPLRHLVLIQGWQAALIISG